MVPTRVALSDISQKKWENVIDADKIKSNENTQPKIHLKFAFLLSHTKKIKSKWA